MCLRVLIQNILWATKKGKEVWLFIVSYQIESILVKFKIYR